ncbi:MAG: hypothetical protein MJ175_13120, partial [Clostridia bacterium]|nr:hypothetical protein [Clostridia bacterium]
MKKQILTSALTAALMLSVLASCGDEAQTPATDTNAPVSAVTTAEITEPAKQLYTEALTPVDYNGAEFSVYT